VRDLSHARADATGADGGHRAVEDASPTVHKRFIRIGAADDIETLGVRLREMVLLLRAARIPLDYGRLADQLCRWQDVYKQEDVRRSWGREFHQVHPKQSGGSGDEASSPETPEVQELDTGD
jgi:CRISPR system Cascade subunit CasB